MADSLFDDLIPSAPVARPRTDAIAVADSPFGDFGDLVPGAAPAASAMAAPPVLGDDGYDFLAEERHAANLALRNPGVPISDLGMLDGRPIAQPAVTVTPDGASISGRPYVSPDFTADVGTVGGIRGDLTPGARLVRGGALQGAERERVLAMPAQPVGILGEIENSLARGASQLELAAQAAPDALRVRGERVEDRGLADVLGERFADLTSGAFQLNPATGASLAGRLASTGLDLFQLGDRALERALPAWTGEGDFAQRRRDTEARDTLIREALDYQRTQAENPMSVRATRLLSPAGDTLGEQAGSMVETVRNDPAAVGAALAGILPESLLASIPTIVGGAGGAVVGGPAGAAAGAAGGGGLTGAVLQYVPAITDYLNQNGLRVDQLNQPGVLDAALAYAETQAQIGGAVEALAGGVAGANLVPERALSGAIRRELLNEAVAQPLAQGAIGAGGAAAQQTAGGQPLNLGELAAEFAGEAAMGPIEAGPAAISRVVEHRGLTRLGYTPEAIEAMPAAKRRVVLRDKVKATTAQTAQDGAGTPPSAAAPAVAPDALGDAPAPAQAALGDAPRSDAIEPQPVEPARADPAPAQAAAAPIERPLPVLGDDVLAALDGAEPPPLRPGQDATAQAQAAPAPEAPAADADTRWQRPADEPVRRWRQTSRKDSQGRPIVEPVLDYSRDGLLEWLGASGGVQFDELASYAGTDPALLRDAAVTRPFKRVGWPALRRTGGMDLDTLTERMIEDGWIAADDRAAAADLVMDALNGRPVQHPSIGGELRGERQQQAMADVDAMRDAELADALGYPDVTTMYAEIEAGAEAGQARSIALDDFEEARSLQDLADRLIDKGFGLTPAEVDAIINRAGDDPAAQARALWAELERRDGEDYGTDWQADRGAVEGGAAARGVAERFGPVAETAPAQARPGEAVATPAGVPAEAASPDRRGGGGAEAGPQAQGASDPVTAASRARADLFPAATQREAVEAERARRDAQRDGRTGTGRTDMASGGGELFAGRRPQQADLAGPVEASSDLFVTTRGQRQAQPEPERAPESVEPPASIPRRPDYTPAIGRRGSIAVKHLVDRYGGTVVGDAMARDFREHGTAMLAGRTVKSAGDLAAIAQVYRNPVFEVMRYVFVDGATGLVKGETAVSSRLPSSASIFPTGEKPAEWAAARAKEFGADTVWLMHNHPSGDPTPSAADNRVTSALNEALRPLGVRVAGHVVLNHERFARISPDGKVTDFDQIPNAKGGQDPLHPLAGPLARITGPSEAATVGKSIYSRAHQDAVSVFVTDAKNNVTIAANFPVAMLGNRRGSAILSAIAQRSRGVRVFLVVDESRITPAVRKEVMRASAVHRVLADVILVAPDGSVRSAAATGAIPGVVGASFNPPVYRRRDAEDGGGQRVYERDGDQTQTPAFRRGFGDSKVDDGTGLPINSDGTVTVYHHTSSEAADAIRRTGRLRSAGEPDVYVTTRRDADIGYGDTVVAVRVRPDQLQLDDEFPDGRRDFRIDTGKPGGSIAVKVGEAEATSQPAVDQTQTPAFKRWFGDSKVVDADGKPLVVYHGTSSDVTEFSIDELGKAMGNTGYYGAGHYFTEDAEQASRYAGAANMRATGEAGPSLIPAYLSIKNPLEINGGRYASPEAKERSRQTMGRLIEQLVTDRRFGPRPDANEAGSRYASVMRMLDRGDFDGVVSYLFADLGGGSGITYYAQRAGFDGVIVTRGQEDGTTIMDEIVAFRPEQIKSAAANSGAFDPNNPSILREDEAGYADDGVDLRSTAGAPEPRTTERLRADARAAVDDLRSLRTVLAPGGALRAVNRLRAVVFDSLQSRARDLEAKYPKATALRELFDLYFEAPGYNRLVPETIPQATEARQNVFLSRIERHLAANGLSLETMTPAQNRQLRNALLGVDDGVPRNVRAAAELIRREMDVQRDDAAAAGIEVGLVTDIGYLTRLYDESKIAGDEAGFLRDATAHYRSEEFKRTMGVPRDVLYGDGTFARFAAALRAAATGDPGLTAQLNRLRELARSYRASSNVRGEAQAMQDIISAVYPAVAADWSRRKAQAWLHAIRTPDISRGFNGLLESGAPVTRERVLSGAADVNLQRWMRTDVREILQAYIGALAPKIEEARRIGTTPEALQGLLDRASAQGMSSDDLQEAVRLLDAATATRRFNSPVAQGAAEIASAWTYLTLLGRSLFASMYEAVAFSLRTGQLRHTIAPLVMAGRALAAPLGNTTARELRRLAVDIGVNGHRAVEDAMLATNAGGEITNALVRRTATAFFRGIWLTRLTEAQRAYGVGASVGYLKSLARQYKRMMEVRGTGDGPVLTVPAMVYFNELGIADHAGFADWILRQPATPKASELFDENGRPTPMGGAFMAATRRLVNQSIQNVRPEHRTEWQNSAGGRIFGAIMGYSMAAYTNLLRREFNLQRTLVREFGAGAGAKRAAVFAVGATALYANAFIVSALREALFNQARFEDKDEEEIVRELVGLAATRGFGFGAVDPLLQLVTGLKYRKSITETAAGATIGTLAQDAQAVAQVFGPNNSPATDTAEFKAVEAVYRSAVTPLLNIVLSRIPFLSGIAIPAASGSNMRKRVAGLFFTEPEARSDLDDDYTAATKQITAAKSRISEELAGLPRNQWARELAELKREYPTLLEGLTLDRYADTPQNRKLGRAGRVKTTDEGAPQLTFRAPKAGTGSLYAELEGYPAGKGKTTKGLRDVASDMSKAIGSVRRTRDIRVGDLAALTDGMDGPAIEEVRAKAAENPGKLAGARLRNAVLEDMLAERRKVKRAVVRLVERAEREGRVDRGAGRRELEGVRGGR